MQSWTGGYVADLEYVSDFHLRMSPHHMHAAALLNGWQPAALPEDFTYLELGCGVGHTLTVLAAANPRAQFIGVDFLPGHILSARTLAEGGAVDNVSFVEEGFAALADAPEPRLPQCDIIALHGVWSWVSPENRHAIVRLLARHLKTGGLAYVSFNALPGQALGVPVQRLLLELSRTKSGRSDERVRHAVDIATRLSDAGAALLKDNPALKLVRSQAEGDRYGYLSHEYINESWHPMYFADVAVELAEAKLGYIGPVDPLNSFAALNLSAEQMALVGEFEDPMLQETLRDYCVVNGFRRDVFARGARRLTAAGGDRLLRDVRLCLTAPKSRIGYSVKVPVGDATMNEAAYAPMFAALAEAPRSVGELLALPDVRANTALHPGEVLGMMVGSNQAAVMPAAGHVATMDAAAGTAQALNRVIAEAALLPGLAMSDGFAAPALGGGLNTDLIERLLYLGLVTGVPAAPEALADHLIPLVLARGDQITRDNKAIQDEAERRAHVVARIGEFIAERLPMWRQVGIL